MPKRMLKPFITIICSSLLLGCVEVNGFGLWQSKGVYRELTLYSDAVPIHNINDYLPIFKTTIPSGLPDGYQWTKTDDFRRRNEKHKSITLYNAGYRGILVANIGFISVESRLEPFVAALQGKISLEEAGRRDINIKSTFIDKITKITQQTIDGVRCVRVEAIMTDDYHNNVRFRTPLVQVTCPVFIGNDLYTPQYTMSLQGVRGIYDDEDRKRYLDMYDVNLRSFDQIVANTRFLQPVSQKVPEGYSAAEQEKRIDHIRYTVNEEWENSLRSKSDRQRLWDGY